MKKTATFAMALFPCLLMAQSGTMAPKKTLPVDPSTTPGKEVPTEVGTDVKGAVKTARVFFIEPKDGATVPKTFTVKMGVEGIKIRPAGEAVDEMTSGHHHLIVDGKGAAAGQVVPADEKHIHFGKGQTEHTLTLAPGEHTLTLQFADGAHRSFGPKMSQTIKVKVQ